ncbi:hypothetical protein KKF32_04880 [Patescibacteria group bacterium]|nr:hypothetical protein [Patescibacteria group bacterium]
MPLFQLQNNKVSQLPFNPEHFNNEASLRDFFAENLEALLGLRFLDNEYPTKDGRIDTLAIDETNTPVIIEYKWSEKDNILSQGLFYMDWLKENKRQFNLLVESKLGRDIAVNWSSPRLLLIAQGFDRYTLSAVKQVKNTVELIKYAPYSSEVLFLETVYGDGSQSPKNEVMEKKAKGDYSVEYHLSKVNKEIKDIFYTMQEEITKWANVEEKAEQKTGITYKTTKSFVRFEFGKSYIDILVRDSRYGIKLDPKQMVKDITSLGWGYNGRIKIKSKNDVLYVLDLIRQSYESTL